jgi:hypothetical protein
VSRRITCVAATAAMALGLGVTVPALAAPSQEDPLLGLLSGDGGLFGSGGLLGADGGLLPALLGGHSDVDELVGGTQDLAGGMGELFDGLLTGDAPSVGGDSSGEGSSVSIGPLHGVGLLGGLLGRF